MAMTKKEREEYFSFAWIAQDYSDALIEIAAAFGRDLGAYAWCKHCRMSVLTGCYQWCAGLKARRALGVA